MKVYRAGYYLVGMPHLLRQLSARDSRPIGQHQKFQQLKFLENSKEYSLVGTQAQVIDENSDKLYKLSYPEKDESLRKNILRKL